MRQIRPCYSSEHQIRRHVHQHRVPTAHFTTRASNKPHLQRQRNYLHPFTTDILIALANERLRLSVKTWYGSFNCLPCVAMLCVHYIYSSRLHAPLLFHYSTTPLTMHVTGETTNCRSYSQIINDVRTIAGVLSLLCSSFQMSSVLM